MEKADYFAAYDLKNKEASELFEETNRGIEELNLKEKADLSQRKKEITSNKKAKKATISKCETKKNDDITRIDGELATDLSNLGSAFLTTINEIDKSIIRTKMTCSDEIESINFNKTKLNGTTESEKVDVQNKNNDTLASRKKSFDELEKKREIDINQIETKQKSKENELNANINTKINEYYLKIKGIEDANKTIVNEKSEEEKNLNNALEEKKKLINNEFDALLKEKQDALGKAGITKVEVSALNKEIKAITKNNEIENKNIEKEKESNTKNLQLFLSQEKTNLETQLEIERKELINFVTTTQGEIDVSKIDLDIALKTKEAEYAKEKENYLLMELKEKNDFEVAVSSLDSTKEIDIFIENSKIDISKKKMETNINKLNIDTEYETKKKESMDFDLGKCKSMEKDTVIFEFNKEKEKNLAEIDIEEYTLNHDSRIIVLNAQKSVLMLKQAVYHKNCEMMLTANSVVIDYKRKRISEELKPFIEEINLKQEEFKKKYDCLIENQKKEYDDTVNLLKDINDRKQAYLEKSLALINETDEEIKMKYGELISIEKSDYENSIKELTSMNDVVTNAYNNKIENDIIRTKEEIDSLCELNEYINDIVDKVSVLSSKRLDEATNNYAKFNEEFESYYEREMKKNEDEFDRLVLERKNLLSDTLKKLESEYASLVQNVDNEKNSKKEELQAFENECNERKKKLDDQLSLFVEDAKNKNSSYSSDHEKALDNLVKKCENDFAFALKKMNSDNLQREKLLSKEIAMLNKQIKKTNSKIISNIKFNYKNANIVKNKQWWIKQDI